MSEFTLVIGNKNYSSWSLRPWMLLRHLGLAFDEVQIALSQPDTQQRIAQHSPAGRVPVLKHRELTLWESIAIGEYLCELTARGWPRERAARAQARVLSAEMHAGFQALRNQWPMNARALGRRTPMTTELAADIERVERAVERLPAALRGQRAVAVAAITSLAEPCMRRSPCVFAATAQRCRPRLAPTSRISC